MRCKTMLFTLALAVLTALPAVSQTTAEGDPAEGGRAEVLILGTYHMSNPGQDVFNTQADDVLAPKRQSEIEQVLDALAMFRPTKIALEAGFNRNDRMAKLYADYLAGEHTLTRNERQQLGFRLARKVGHETVYSVDVDGEFPYMRLANYVKAAGRTTQFEALNQATGNDIEAFEAYLASHTVLEALLQMNSEERIAESMAWYFKMAEFGESWDWPGADLVADWFRRNMRIYTNIVQLVESPDERVLVIYGAGHLGWLQFAVDSNPDLRLRKLAEFAD